MAAQNMDHQWSPNPDKTAFNTSTTEGFLETYFESIRTIVLVMYLQNRQYQ
jgi:hypothetical protein